MPGFAKGTSPYVPYPKRLVKDEMERMDCLSNCIQYYNEIGTGDEREIVYAKFCAYHLPAVVERFLDSPILGLSGGFPNDFYELFNTSLILFLKIHHIPYFTKYLRSQKPVAARGKILTKTLAERIAAFGAYLDRRQAQSQDPERLKEEIEVVTDLLVEALRLLSIFIMFFSKWQTEIPMETRNNLTRYLLKWRQPGWDPSLQDSSAGVLSDLRGMSSLMSNYVEAGRKQLRARDKCAYPGCEIRENLMSCVRCSIVAYCSTEHQKAHWDPRDVPAHKPTCFETEY